MTDSSTPRDDADVDVVVIGGGPVGKFAALRLGRLGHSVVVFERKDAAYPLPRAVAHDAEIARVLQNTSMPVNELTDAVEPYDDLYVWKNGKGETLHEVDWRGFDSSGWNNTYFYNQPGMERHIEQRLTQQPSVEFRRGEHATLERQDDSHVVVRAGDEEITARYVLAADGAKSAVRTALGIGWTDLGYFHDWLVVDVIPSTDMQKISTATQLADPQRPTTVVPGGPGRRRWEFMRLEGESVEELTDPTRIWELLAPFSVTPDNAELDRGVVYTFSSGFATSFRSSRVFLLGDAAHQMPPFAGQGLAAGLRDCVNLSWKLDLVLNGKAPNSLLDTYGPERRAHVSDFIDFSISLGQIICILDEDEAAERDLRMKAEVAAANSPEAAPQPRLGEGIRSGDQGGYLSWQGKISVPDHDDIRFDDVFGPGALILGCAEDARALDEALVESLQNLGVAVTCFDPEFASATGIREFTDTAGTYRRWFDELGVNAVLIRPDLYVFGACTVDDGSTQLARSYVQAVTAS